MKNSLSQPMATSLRLCLSIMSLCFFALPGFAQSIEYEPSIEPLLRQNCIACHHAKKAEGGLNLEDYAGLLRGGDTGATLDKETPGESLLLKRISGSVEPLMPPEENTAGARPLTADEQELIKRWIAGGAISNGRSQWSKDSADRKWQQLPESVRSIYSLAVTPEGDYVVVGKGQDVMFFPVEDFGVLSDPSKWVSDQVHANAHLDAIYSVAISSDGTWAATGSSDSVKIWRRVEHLIESVATTNSPPTLPQPTDLSLEEQYPFLQAVLTATPLELVAVSPDGTLVAALDASKNLRVWKTADGSLVGSIQSDRMVEWKARQSKSATDRQTQNVERLTKATQESDGAVTSEAKAVETAKTARDNAMTELAKKETEMQMASATLADHLAAIEKTKAAIEAATKQLGELNGQTEPKQKAIKDLEQAKTVAQTKANNLGQALAASEAAQQNAGERASLRKQELESQRSLLQLLEAKNRDVQEAKTVLPIVASELLFTKDSQRLVAFARPGKMSVFSLKPMQRIANLVESLGPNPVSISASKDDRGIVLSNADGQVQSQSIRTHWVLEREIMNPIDGTDALFFRDRVTALAFDPNCESLAIGSGLPSRTGDVTIVSLADGGIRQKWFELHSDNVSTIAFSPDGKTLATGATDRMLKLTRLDAEPSATAVDSAIRPTRTRTFEGHTHHVLGVAWQDSGARIASAGADGNLRIWDTESGETVRNIAINQELTAVTFLGTTARVATTAIDRHLRIYDSVTGKLEKQNADSKDALYSVAVTGDGRYAIVAGQDGLVRAIRVTD